MNTAAQSTMPSGLVGGIGKQQDKDWCDLTVDEKIERNRMITKSVMRQNEHLTRKCYTLESMLRDHKHTTDGRTAIDMGDHMERVDRISESDVALKRNMVDEMGKVYF